MKHQIDLFLAVPRSGSTVLELAFKNSGYYESYFHEPMADNYYQRKNPTLPGMHADHMQFLDYETFKKQVREAAQKGRVLVKDMVYHLFDNIIQDQAFVKEVNIVLLMREPVRAIQSHLSKNIDASSEEIGFERMYQFALKLKGWGQPFWVVDYDDLVKRPQDTLFTLCSHLDLLYQPGMHLIEADEDFKRQTAKFEEWHAVAVNSTKIEEKKPEYKVEANHPRVQALLAEHQPFYDKLLGDKMEIVSYTASVKTEFNLWRAVTPTAVSKSPGLDKKTKFQQNGGFLEPHVTPRLEINLG